MVNGFVLFHVCIDQLTRDFGSKLHDAPEVTVQFALVAL